ncbi:MAG: protein-disulfide reductase DsbD [Gammaproteobacteria bacterium]
MRKYSHLLFLLLALVAVRPALALSEGDLLSVDDAFSFKASMANADTAKAVWTIAKDYHLYRDKISFRTDTPGIKLGQPKFSPALTENDEVFGKVQVYRDHATVEVPIIREDPSVKQFTLIAKSQGCADAGVCYPPHTQKATLTLAAADTGSTNAGTDQNATAKDTSAQQKLNDLDQSLGLDQSGDEFLPPDQAFAFKPEVGGSDTIVGHWKIAKGYYLYRDKFEFKLQDAQGVSLGEVSLPPGQTKQDPLFGKVQVFHDSAQATLHLKRSATDAMPVTLVAKFQGCAEAGVCYPPITKKVTLQLPAAGASTSASGGEAQQAPSQESSSSSAKAPVEGTEQSEGDRFTQILTQGNLLQVILAALGFGILLAFTACMYPMIPILSSIIVGQGEHATAAKGFFLALIYVLGLAVTFGVIGGITAWAAGGVGLQAYFQSPWLLIPFTILFVILALGMFGFFNIQMPSFIQSRLSQVSNEQKGGTLFGVAIMGVLSALIVGPCGGPVLIAALGYAATSADLAKGFLALFFLGFGMGLPLLVVGAGGSKLLPRAGTWMDTVKATAGVILLGVALVFLERMPGIFPPMLTMLLWSALFIVAGIYMGALTSPQPDWSGWRKLWKGLGLTLLLYGVVVMLGGLSGGTNVADPLHGSRLLGARTGTAGGAGPSAEHEVQFKRIKTVADLKRELAAAKAAGKPVMLDFYADWCGYCKQYESYVWGDPAVKRALSNAVLLQADVTATDAEDKALMKHVGVYLPPAILFFKNGQEERKFRVVGFMNAQEFAKHAEQAFGAG